MSTLLTFHQAFGLILAIMVALLLTALKLKQLAAANRLPRFIKRHPDTCAVTAIAICYALFLIPVFLTKWYHPTPRSS